MPKSFSLGVVIIFDEYTDIFKKGSGKADS